MKRTSRILAWILVIAMFITVMPVTASAATEPLMLIDYTETPDTVSYGDYFYLEFMIFPEYKNEEYHVYLYDSYGYLMGSVDSTYYNTSTAVKYVSIGVDTYDLELTPGTYKAVYWLSYYTYGYWHDTSSLTYYFTVTGSSTGSTCTYGHTYDNSCDPYCNVCGEYREVTHTYDNDCDPYCNVCYEEREVTHTYDNDCDPYCNVCDEYREVTHTYYGDCDSDCNVCGENRDPLTDHTYTDSADTICDVCGYVRPATGYEPTIVIDYGTTPNTVVYGETFNLEFVIDPEYASEEYHIYLYNSDGELEGSVESSYVNYSSDIRYLSISVDTDDLELDPGTYEVVFWLSYYNNGIRYDTASQSYHFTVTSGSTCAYGHTYDYPCSSICSVCGEYREPLAEHTYTDSADTTCDVCGFVRPGAGSDASQEGVLFFDLNFTGDGYMVVACDKSATGEVVIPATYNGKPVTGIFDMSECTGVTSIVAEGNIEIIYPGAFIGCSGLTSVTLPSSVYAIGGGAFEGCTNLTTLTVSGNIDVIGGEVFTDCNIKKLFIAYGSTAITKKLISALPGLQEIAIPLSVTSIEDYAFSDIYNLSAVYYCGTQEQWQALTNTTGNSALTSVVAQLHYFVDGVCCLCLQTDECHHNWYAATCTEPATCSVCGEVSGEALGHSWVAATYTSPMTCSTCGATEGDVLSCQHNMQQTAAAIAPTCETPGKTAVSTCLNCGATEGGVEIPALGHNMQETSPAVAATCTTAGKTATKSCAHGCGKTEGGETIPATGHTFQGDTCVVCGQGKFMMGDANGDSKLNLRDAILVLQASNGKDVEVDEAAADVTGDGKMNIRDAILILKRANGNKDPFPAEK